MGNVWGAEIAVRAAWLMNSNLGNCQHLQNLQHAMLFKAAPVLLLQGEPVAVQFIEDIID